MDGVRKWAFLLEMEGGWWRRGVVDGFKIVKLLDELGRGSRKLIEKTRPTGSLHLEEQSK